jgi:outer membrane protein TolC
MKPPLFLLSAALLASGCTVGPNYKRPTVTAPGSYRGPTTDQAVQTGLAAFGDQKWWDIFQDEQLRTLIRTALAQNYDLRIAASRVLEAGAQLGIIRADQFPSLGAGVGIPTTVLPSPNFFQHLKRAQNRQTFPQPGNLISGESIGAQRKRQERISLRVSGHGGRFFRRS